MCFISTGHLLDSSLHSCSLLQNPVALNGLPSQYNAHISVVRGECLFPEEITSVHCDAGSLNITIHTLYPYLRVYKSYPVCNVICRITDIQ